MAINKENENIESTPLYSFVGNIINLDEDVKVKVSIYEDGLIVESDDELFVDVYYDEINDDNWFKTSFDDTEQAYRLIIDGFEILSGDNEGNVIDRSIDYIESFLISRSKISEKRQLNYIKSNPFYILDVSMSASKNEIIDKSEELSFFDENNECIEAASVLNNPVKRIEAETRWFPGETKKIVAQIRKMIDSNENIDYTGLKPSSQINLYFAEFLDDNQIKLDDLFDNIIALDVLFEKNDVETLCNEINRNRDKAGFPKASIDRIIDAKNKQRTDIRQAIDKKLEKLDDEEYVAFITSFTEDYICNKDCNYGLVADDVINQYEIRMQSIIEDKTENIRGTLRKIKESSQITERKKLVDAFIKQLKDWDVYVQPLQLKANIEGHRHNVSQQIANESRETSILINNVYQDVDLSIKIVDALKKVFAELPEYISQLYKDSIVLNENKRASDMYKNVKTTSTTTGNAGGSVGKSLASGCLIPIIILVVFSMFIGLFDGGNSSDYSYEDDYYEEEQQLEEKEMPANEHQFVNKFSSRPSEIIVENPTDNAYYMKFTDENDNTVFAFFVRPQSTAPMYMGLGTYYLKYACGKTWYGKKHLFGPETSYYKDDEGWTFTSDKYWTLTLQSVNGNLSVDSIDEEDF